MAIKTCVTDVEWYVAGEKTSLTCRDRAVGCIYIDSKGWQPICGEHLRNVLDRLGPTVVRSL